jgi:DNA-binding NarL/FixJ family response regulator
MRKPRLLLADDHNLVMDGLKLMFEPEFELVGCVENGRALLEAAQQLVPDLILLDISMPLLNGLDAAVQLCKLLPGVKLIFVTMHEDADFVIAALKAGAEGYVVKRAAASELLTAIREVLKGHSYVSPLIARNTIDLFLGASSGTSKLAHSLTARQREILQLVAEGRSRREIAAILNISVKTVEFHKAALMRELDLHNSATLTRYAIEHGLIINRAFLTD